MGVGGDILSLVTDYDPEMPDSGFPTWATTNQLYHAALLLAGRGGLLIEADEPTGVQPPSE